MSDKLTKIKEKINKLDNLIEEFYATKDRKSRIQIGHTLDWEYTDLRYMICGDEDILVANPELNDEIEDLRLRVDWCGYSAFCEEEVMF